MACTRTETNLIILRRPADRANRGTDDDAPRIAQRTYFDAYIYILYPGSTLRQTAEFGFRDKRVQQGSRCEGKMAPLNRRRAFKNLYPELGAASVDQLPRWWSIADTFLTITAASTLDSVRIPPHNPAFVVTPVLRSSAFHPAYSVCAAGMLL